MSSTIATAEPTADHAGTDQESRAIWFEERFAMLHENVNSFVKGMSEKTRMALVCLLAEGHLLIEDVPGVGKTSLAKAIANSIGMSMSRVQCTPDLLPGDVTGVNIFHFGRSEFEFTPGPAFSHLLFADELNRASPKTQSAFLEVMEERRVTVGGTTYTVPAPFILIATQNSSDTEGTYPLLDGQIERFLMRIELGYPDVDSEVQMLQNESTGRSVDELRPVIDESDALAMTVIARQTHASNKLLRYVARICIATRTGPPSSTPHQPARQRGAVAGCPLARCQFRAPVRVRRRREARRPIGAGASHVLDVGGRARQRIAGQDPRRDPRRREPRA